MKISIKGRAGLSVDYVTEAKDFDEAEDKLRKSINNESFKLGDWTDYEISEC